MAADGKCIAFLASGRGTSASLILWQAGGLREFAQTGDEFDGQVAHSFGLGPQALSGEKLAFQVEFENGEKALYLSHLGVD